MTELDEFRRPRRHPMSRATRRLLSAALAVLLVGAGAAASAAAGASAASAHVPPDPPGKPHTVTWDPYSLMIDGQRTVIWSGEFHPFRLPSPSLWRDVLEKMKAEGYNAVSLYFDWGYHSPAQGV